MSTRAHKAQAPQMVKVVILSISTTRDLAQDNSGHWIKKRLSKKHQVVLHEVIPDDEEAIAGRVREIIEEYVPDVILTTGGTGIGPEDVTIEAIRPWF